MVKKVIEGVWSGRTDSLENNKESLRYHQIVELARLDTLDTKGKACVIIGFESDEGVRRNKGQIGAAKAPNELRSELAKLPWNLSSQKYLVDVGTIDCTGNDLEKAQQQLGDVVNQVLTKKMTPIILGGGHETAYGHYLGVRNNIGKAAKLGIINIDAHFDLRPYDEQSSSGTMFREILVQDENSSYLVIGIQRYGITQALFDKADELGVTYICEEDMHGEQQVQVNVAIEQFIQNNDFIMLTLCPDVLNAAFAPGVSASSPFGLSPYIVRTIIRTVTSSEKTKSFDISEVNPLLDENNRTVKLGAYLVNEAIISFLN
ncbi:formiminoglutamase [Psychrobacillus sp. OK032]|nr:formiminoglutamase [Psychrobacillus sp. OK032]